MVDLVAKRTTSKVSAQWSNDESVHQILVELLNGENVDTSELLRKVRLKFLRVCGNGRKRPKSYG